MASDARLFNVIFLFYSFVIDLGERLVVGGLGAWRCPASAFRVQIRHLVAQRQLQVLLSSLPFPSFPSQYPHLCFPIII